MSKNTEWNLSQLYKSPSDSKIEKDLLVAEKAYRDFEKRYKTDTSYLSDESALRNALLDYEKLIDLPVSKTLFYLHLLSDKDSRNEIVRAQKNLVSQKLQKLGNTIIFFEINLSKISSKLQPVFIKSNKLQKYSYFLKKIFDNSKYVLSEPEEKILSLKSLPSHILWTEATKKVRNKQTIEYKKKHISISEAESLIRELPTQAERKELHDKVMQKNYELSEIVESEINAIITNKKINDELRGFKEPYDSTILGYENDKKSVLNLVSTVTNNFNVAHKFYKVKARMLGLNRLLYSDRGATVGKTKKQITYKQSVEILQKLFSSIDYRFGEILSRFVLNRQIDVYPSVGKTGGAYCSSDHKLPTFVLLNHTDSFESLRTFAHEMGHAIHSEFSKSQPVLYEGYSMATAEVASTLFESFLFYDQFEKLNEDEKIIALHDKIQDDISTIFRQIACFNFELDIHKKIRQNGNMSREEMAKCMNRRMKDYLGGMFDLYDNDGYFFVGWSHIRSFFYVYSYAFGQLSSKALYKKYKQDASYIEKIKTFLSLGGSKSPEDIFKSIGVDTRKSDFFQKGIDLIKEDIELLDKLVSKKYKK